MRMEERLQFTTRFLLSIPGKVCNYFIQNASRKSHKITEMVKLPKYKVRAIGVSNFTPEHIEALVSATSITPAVLQVERHPLLQQSDTLVKFCKEKGIHLTAYSVSYLRSLFHIEVSFLTGIWSGFRKQQCRSTPSARASNHQRDRRESSGHPRSGTACVGSSGWT